MTPDPGDLALARIIGDYRRSDEHCRRLEAELKHVGYQLRQLAENLEDVGRRKFSVPDALPPLADVARKLGDYYEWKQNRDRLGELRASLDPDFHPPS